MVVLTLLYLFLCLLIGYLGKNRKFGFWGYLALALFFSPVIGFIIMIASDERPDQVANMAEK